ncbi:GNAT family N-acetyltransferase [Sphingomonas daechungensis]|uniref:bifunctional helix-turn-helix transcriptional regulator/GNAT family N-acetyltransferase n=1 Tax=Sphingomonas daechungensis TaxID=1176646 RepID=UPI003784359C
MQASAALLIAGADLPVQPGHIPFLVALDNRAMSVGQLVEAVGISQPGVTRAIGQLTVLGFVQSQQGRDQRQRTVSLTPQGSAALRRAREHVWPQVEQAVRSLLRERTDAFLQELTDVENALSDIPLHTRAEGNTRPLKIHAYSEDLAHHFREINEEWINGMFRLEPADRELLDNPRELIEAGGDILFVEARGRGIVGTCALKKSGPSSYELTKMGVRENARGLKAGEFLLAATIERAMSLKADPLYLLTNSKCEAAIHLYEKLGFQHDADIMSKYAARYERCDVAMRYEPRPQAIARTDV